MKLSTVFEGSGDPFEGDHTIWLRGLPLGARATRATVRLIPALPTGATPFLETFVFNDSTPDQNDLDADDWGITKTAPASFIEVDFHARRTLALVTGTGGGATLQVNLGGAYFPVAVDGTLTPGTPWPISLSGDTSEPLPGLTVNKFKLSQATGNINNLTITKVTIRSVPTNLTVKLGQMPPFWVRVGELAVVDTSPDYADTLNTFLDTAPNENGYYQIPFIIHTDTLGRLDVELDIDYVMEQAVLPPHLPEVILPYNFSTLPGADEKLTTVALPRQAIPVAGRSTAQIRGEFQPTRVRKGNVGEEPPVFPMRVSPDFSLAQAFQSDIEIALTGIDVPLANTQTGLAGMNITLQEDADGKPFGEVLIRADVRVDRPLPGQSSWGSATLSSPFRILRGRRYWLVLQSLIGEAYWNASAGALEIPTLQCSRDGGMSWRAATATGAPSLLSALFRLRDQPDRFSIPVQLQIGKGSSAVRRRLDEYAPLGRIEFSFDFADKLAEHLDKPELDSPCSTGELLVNSDFNDPPHDDATQRLFGRESANGLSQGMVDLSQGVDLTVERFLTVSADSKPPIRIDCAGTNPSKTTLSEIITAANRAARQEIFEEEIEGNARFLAIRSDVDLQILPWCKPEVPTGWQGISGQVLHGKSAESGLMYARVLAHVASTLDDLPIDVIPCFSSLPSTLFPLNSETAQLSQRVRVVGGCLYRLHIAYEVGDFDQPPPTWQIEWLGANQESLRTDEGEIGFKSHIVKEESAPWLYELKLAAPVMATEADVRLIQQSPGAFFLYTVSLSPTLESLLNGRFAVWHVDSHGFDIAPPIGWILHGSVDPLDDLPNGAKLRGDGPEDAVLSQVTDVIAGETYELQVSVYPVSRDDPVARPVQQRARLELHWLGDAGRVGPPVIMPLDGKDFPLHALSGVAPEDAKQAEIRLVQPRGRDSLFIESVSLMQVDLVNVPLIFLAETPGELTVSDLKVTYDLLQPPEEVPNGVFPQERSAMARLAGIGSTDSADQPTKAAPVARIEIEVAPRESPLAHMPVAIVAGVGERFSKTLQRLRNPVKTIADLAALDPEADIKTIPRERRLELKTAAEMILAIDLNVEPFGALQQELLEELLTMPPEKLADQAGESIVLVEQLQRGLRALRLLIKNDEFRKLHLEDLELRQD
jgi:hypothetical protein